MVGGSALVAAIVAEVRYKNLDSFETTIIEQASYINDQDNLFLILEAMSGLVFATTGVSLFVGLVCLLGRTFYDDKCQIHRITIVLVMHDRVCVVAKSALFDHMSMKPFPLPSISSTSLCVSWGMRLLVCWEPSMPMTG